jgi:ribulose-phosphate 3-epimerase
MTLITPAVLPSSREDFEEKLGRFARMPQVSRIQIDVVDGKFATPASWPYTAPKELATRASRHEMLPELHRIAYEIDLMCLDAERAAEAWLALGASRLTFHAESAMDLSRLLTTVRERYGDDFVSFGLALNVASDLALIEAHLDRVEYVQFMGIAKIGRQGQPFDRRVVEKIRVFHKRHPDIAVQVDGGVSFANAKELLALGVSSLVVGSAILKASDPAAELSKFEALVTPYGV